MLVLVFILLFATSALADQSCLSCHLNLIGNSIYIHPPINEEKCTVCHTPADSAESTEKKKVKEVTIRATNIRNFATLYLQKNHIYALTLTVSDNHGNEVKKTISPLQLESIPESNDTTPPVIQNFCISKIEQGIFYTAELEWTTNEPGIAKVEYAIEGTPQGIIEEENYSFTHKITLGGLEAGKTCSVSVYVKDLFGNKSAPYKTEFVVKPATYNCNHPSATQKTDSKLAILEFRIVRKGRKAVVFWKTPEATSSILTLRSLDTAQETRKTEKNRAHPPFVKPNDITTTCMKCHPEKSKEMAHPVNVSLSLPTDLPLKKGRITCITCHSPHATDHPFILRKSHTQELCISCHKK